MTKIEYYTKNKKVYHYEPSEQEAKELQLLRIKSLRARQKQERKERKRYELEHSKGYCPNCFLLRPLTGICPNCN